MIYKERIKPKTLLIRECLSRRMVFTKEEQDIFYNQGKGFDGEGQWDLRTGKLICDCLVLNDLFLEVKGNSFQIDALLLANNKIYLYDVKNFEGTFYYEDGQMFFPSGKEIKNPFRQLETAASSLRRLLQQLGYSYPIEMAVVFINPTFVLFQAPLDLPVLFLPQLDVHFQMLNRIRTPITARQKRLAEKLCSLHIKESRFEKRPVYHYEDVRKGACCARCKSFSLFETGHYCACRECGHRERTAELILRHVSEFQLLFPELKITTRSIQEWCQIIKNPLKIQRVLKRTFTSTGRYKGMHYE